MREIDCRVAVDRIMNDQDDVYILTKVGDIPLNELREVVKKGATLVVLDEQAAEPAPIAQEPAPITEAPRERGFRKSTPYDKAKVIALYNAGWTYSAIAEELGITESTVSGVIYREKRKQKKKEEGNQ